MSTSPLRTTRTFQTHETGVLKRGATWETLSRARSASIVEGLKAVHGASYWHNAYVQLEVVECEDPDVAREAVLTEEGFVQMRPLGSLVATH
eukprot:6408600-Amphidinium_carterae.2